MNWSLAVFLEVMNGVWAILTLHLLWWLAEHFIEMYRKHDGGFWRFMTELPAGLQLVTAITVYHVGSELTRGPIWFARFMGERGNIASMYLNNTLLTVGASIAIVGLLCQIRVISAPVRGGWPWQVAAAMAGVFALGTLATNF